MALRWIWIKRGELEAVDAINLNMASSHSINCVSINSDGAVLSKAVRSV